MLNPNDPNTWDNTGTNSGDPLRYATADSHAIEYYPIPPYTSGNDDNAYLIPEQDTPDHDLQNAPAFPDFPTDIFDEHLHRFFTNYAKEFDTYGQAIPLSGAAGSSAIAAGGLGVIYGLLANASTVASVAITIYRGIDQTAIPIYYLNIPTAIDATHPGVLNTNIGTNGMFYPGLLSYTASAQFTGMMLVRRKVAL
jgi:hypothetical protein